MRRTFEGDAENPLGQVQAFWIPRSHETKQGVNGGEPDVSCRRSVLAFPLEIGEKRKDSRWIQIRQVEFRHRALLAHGEKPQKQHKAVAVTVNGVRARSAKTRQVVGEVIAHYGCQAGWGVASSSLPPFQAWCGHNQFAVVAGESFACSRPERLDPVQVIVGGGHGSVPHIGGQQRELGLNLGALPIPAQQSIHGKAVTKIMNPRQPPLRGEDGALLEEGPTDNIAGSCRCKPVHPWWRSR